MNVRRSRGAMAAMLITFAATACSAPPPTPSEQTFIARVARVLNGRYPTMKAAEAAGYMPLTGRLDSDNTYNLSDMTFNNVTLERPNFLWYDRGGRLVGTDYEVPKSEYKTPPDGYAVDSRRWTTIDAHVHLAYTLDGKTVYAEESAQANLAAGPITDASLRKDGFLPDGAVLKWAMYHPTSWDLALWVVPNPKGAFASDNPAVK